MLELVNRLTQNCYAALPNEHGVRKMKDRALSVVHQLAKTSLMGLATYLLCEAISRTPILVKSPHYLPLGPFAKIGAFFGHLNTALLVPIYLMMKDRFTSGSYFCVIGPITEELTERLLLQKWILKDGVGFCAKKLGITYDPNSSYQKIFRIALSSLVFAGAHTWAHGPTADNPYGAASLVYLIAMGSILGYSQESTGNILHPILIHVINNSLTYYISGIPKIAS